MTNGWSTTARTSSHGAHYASTALLLDLFIWLEDWWQQTLVLHKRAIMVAFADASGNTAGDIVLKVAVKCLVFAVFDLEVSKVASTMLSSQRTLLHIDVLILLLFLWIGVVS